MIAEAGGAAGNIQARQRWSSAIPGVTIANEAPFNEGADAIPAINAGAKSLTNRLNEAEDSVIQDCLGAAQNKILDMLARPANDPPPGCPGNFPRRLSLSAGFSLKTDRRREKQTELDLDGIKEQKIAYYRERVFKAVTLEILNLISSHRNVLAFMPPAPGQEEPEAAPRTSELALPK